MNTSKFWESFFNLYVYKVEGGKIKRHTGPAAKQLKVDTIILNVMCMFLMLNTVVNLYFTLTIVDYPDWLFLTTLVLMFPIWVSMYRRVQRSRRKALLEASEAMLKSSRASIYVKNCKYKYK